MFHGCGESIAVYRCAEQAGRRPGRLHQQPAVRRVPRLRAGPGDLRGRVGARRAGAGSSASTRSSCGAATSSCPATRVVDAHVADDDLTFGSYGLDQCLDLAAGRAAPRQRRAAAGRAAVAGRRGHGARDDRHHPAARPLRRRVGLAATPTAATRSRVGTAEFGNGTTTVHAQLAATVLDTDRRPGRIRQSDTDAAVTTPARSARPAPWSPAWRVHGPRCSCATVLARGEAAGVPADRALHRTECSAAAPLRRLRGAAGAGRPAHGDATTAPRGRWRSTCTRSGSRSTSETGEVRILQSVQAADAGAVMNPEQCRGQVEGGVAQAIGAALYEEMRVGTDGA